MTHHLSRRKFLARSAVAATAAGTSIAFAANRSVAAANDRLKVAFIGVGGRGGGNLKSMVATGKVDVVAICDVDIRFVDNVGTQFPDAAKFQDYRKLYDAVGNRIDAAVVSTTEHTHAYATMPALQLGKHVYCEKPLAYNIAETRAITEAAAKAAVVTQMGTQIHATENYHRVVELVQSGAIGDVTEAHVWVGKHW
ncbi:MAG: Gfo/Idh/MocA family oxidoreductase, partial [Planctomycetales bacterium]|nr:Gfo/Idh/MocA family oxidoreductase [Planctomycetales bacterium]